MLETLPKGNELAPDEEYDHLGTLSFDAYQACKDGQDILSRPLNDHQQEGGNGELKIFLHVLHISFIKHLHAYSLF